MEIKKDYYHYFICNVACMNLKEQNKYKSDFKIELDKFVDKLTKYVSTDNGDSSIKGFIDVYKNIYTISSDTKIVSKILEIHTFPQILEFAKNIGYKIILAEKKNWYPDLTFIHEKNEHIKFAVDIKTIFRWNNQTAGFTLGSHGRYFQERDKDKNIKFPYNQYIARFCLGIIYTRTDILDKFSETKIFRVKDIQEKNEAPNTILGEKEITSIKNLKSITSVIKDFEFFSNEKWKIASDKKGSGNTANIGPIIDINDLKNGNGIFQSIRGRMV
ncbi:MAG: type II restriction endonuclease [Chitinophagaceae bacterium]